MSGAKYIVRRLLWSLVVLFGLSILIFCIARIIPGDTATMALGSTATEEAKELYRETHHLNDPFIKQYAYWITDALQGNFGESTQTKQPVVEDIKTFLPATLELILFADRNEFQVGEQGSIKLTVLCQESVTRGDRRRSRVV